jgi:hypothetical protein
MYTITLVYDKPLVVPNTTPIPVGGPLTPATVTQRLTSTGTIAPKDATQVAFNTEMIAVLVRLGVTWDSVISLTVSRVTAL